MILRRFAHWGEVSHKGRDIDCVAVDMAIKRCDSLPCRNLMSVA